MQQFNLYLIQISKTSQRGVAAQQSRQYENLFSGFVGNGNVVSKTFAITLLAGVFLFEKIGRDESGLFILGLLCSFRDHYLN